MKGYKLAAIVGSLGLVPMAFPVLYSYSFSDDDSGLAANVTFDLEDGDWTVVLTNTSTKLDLVPADVLTGVYWELDLTGSLDPDAASLGASTIKNGSAPVDGNVGGEWAFKEGLNFHGNPGVSGVSATGLGLFGPSDRFDTNANLSGPDNVGGMDFGILPANQGVNQVQGNSPIETNPFIQNSVTFTFASTALGPESFPLPPRVWFQYGTSLNEPWFEGDKEIPPQSVPVPEPFTMAIGAAGLAVALRRRKVSR